jgi:hypothetical protein
MEVRSGSGLETIDNIRHVEDAIDFAGDGRSDILTIAEKSRDRVRGSGPDAASRPLSPPPTFRIR